jgi:GET complex subunit GET2
LNDSYLAKERASPSPARPATPSQTAPSPSPAVNPNALPSFANTDEANLQAQEAFLRNMMREQQQPSSRSEMPEDPMARLLSQIAGVSPASSDPNDPNAAPGGLPVSGADLAAATGLPPFVANILTGQSSATKAPPESTVWKIVHTIFAMVVGIYLVWAINNSISMYGKEKPPPPAVAQSPFVIFLTGEAALQGARIAFGQGGGGGLGKTIKIFKDFIRDGAIVVFLLGVSGWWNGGVA